MGEIADAMLSGLFCECCGVYMDGEEPGYPRRCNSCNIDELIHPNTPHRGKNWKRNRKNKEKRRRKAREAKATTDTTDAPDKP